MRTAKYAIRDLYEARLVIRVIIIKLAVIHIHFFLVNKDVLCLQAITAPMGPMHMGRCHSPIGNS